MDKAVIERALRALAEIGAARPLVPDAPRGTSEPTTCALVNLVKAESGPANVSLCGSPDCAGCYDVGDGKKIHPPKCGEGYLKWLENWKPKGKAQ